MHAFEFNHYMYNLSVPISFFIVASKSIRMYERWLVSECACVCVCVYVWIQRYISMSYFPPAGTYQCETIDCFRVAHTRSKQKLLAFEFPSDVWISTSKLFRHKISVCVWHLKIEECTCAHRPRHIARRPADTCVKYLDSHGYIPMRIGFSMCVSVCLLDLILINFKAMACYSVAIWSSVVAPHRYVCRWWPRMANAASPNHCRWYRCRRASAMRPDEKETNQLSAKRNKFADSAACLCRRDSHGPCRRLLLRTTMTSVRRATHSVHSEHSCSTRCSTVCLCICKFCPCRCSHSPPTSVVLPMLLWLWPTWLQWVATGQAMPGSLVASALQIDFSRSIYLDFSDDAADVHFCFSDVPRSLAIWFPPTSWWVACCDDCTFWCRAATNLRWCPDAIASAIVTN